MKKSGLPVKRQAVFLYCHSGTERSGVIESKRDPIANAPG